MSAAGVITAGACDFSALPRTALQRMREAGAEVLECQRVLDKGGLNIVGEVLRGQGEFIEYAHCPADDVYDADTHAQYYYHVHCGSEGEHGRFHTFLRAAGMPAGAVPVPYAGDEPWPVGDAALSHLIGVSMDAYGQPTVHGDPRALLLRASGSTVRLGSFLRKLRDPAAKLEGLAGAPQRGA